jgi:hypothetical protein
MMSLIVTSVVWLPVRSAFADVYRSVDAQGHVQYSDTPLPGAELIHVQKLGLNNSIASSTASSAAAQPTSASTPASPSPPAPDPATQQLAQQAAQQAVQQDVARNHDEQCKQASAAYEQAVQARRIYKSTANGDTEFLSDAEVEKQRLDLYQAMQSLCGSSP